MKDAEDADSTYQNLRLADLFLRLAVLPLTVTSIWVLVKNGQTVESYGKVEFNNLTGLEYLVWNSAIAAGYSLVSVLLSYFRWFNCDWLLFVLDQVAAYLLVTSGSAAIEILYLAQEGDRVVSWSEVCSYYSKFCSYTKVSLVFHLAAMVCLLVLSLISGYRLFSKFEAPPPTHPSDNEVGIGRQGGGSSES